MSFAMSGPLQRAVYDALSADSVLGMIVGSAIYDAVPTGTLPSISVRSEEHTSELQSLTNLVCRLLLETKKKKTIHRTAL